MARLYASGTTPKILIYISVVATGAPFTGLSAGQPYFVSPDGAVVASINTLVECGANAKGWYTLLVDGDDNLTPGDWTLSYQTPTTAANIGKTEFSIDAQVDVRSIAGLAASAIALRHLFEAGQGAPIHLLSSTWFSADNPLMTMFCDGPGGNDKPAMFWMECGSGAPGDIFRFIKGDGDSRIFGEGGDATVGQAASFVLTDLVMNHLNIDATGTGAEALKVISDWGNRTVYFGNTGGGDVIAAQASGGGWAINFGGDGTQVVGIYGSGANSDGIHIVSTGTGKGLNIIGPTAFNNSGSAGPAIQISANTGTGELAIKMDAGVEVVDHTGNPALFLSTSTVEADAVKILAFGDGLDVNLAGSQNGLWVPTQELKDKVEAMFSGGTEGPTISIHQILTNIPEIGAVPDLQPSGETTDIVNVMRYIAFIFQMLREKLEATPNHVKLFDSGGVNGIALAPITRDETDPDNVIVTRGRFETPP